MSKSGITSNVISQKCPRCRTGRLFSDNAYNLKAFAKMNDKCTCCDQRFNLEPSFYQGAMVVSYALQVGIFAAVSITIAVLFPGAGVEWYLGGVTFFAIILAPIVFRLSRSIWIHFFVTHDEKLSTEYSHE